MSTTSSLQAYELLPTRIWHYVSPHESDAPRICIAFNANP